MTEPSPREEGDDGPPLAARVHNNQLLGNSNGEDSGGIDSEGDDKGGKGCGVRGTMTTVATVTMVATATTVTMATRMTPNGDEYNKNGNNKNNDKGTTTVT